MTRRLEQETKAKEEAIIEAAVPVGLRIGVDGHILGRVLVVPLLRDGSEGVAELDRVPPGGVTPGKPTWDRCNIAIR